MSFIINRSFFQADYTGKYNQVEFCYFNQSGRYDSTLGKAGDAMPP